MCHKIPAYSLNCHFTVLTGIYHYCNHFNEIDVVRKSLNIYIFKVHVYRLHGSDITRTLLFETDKIPILLYTRETVEQSF